MSKDEPILTLDLLKVYGQQKPKGRGMRLTYQQLWERRPDKNSRYALRIALLRLDGLIE